MARNRLLLVPLGRVFDTLAWFRQSETIAKGRDYIAQRNALDDQLHSLFAQIYRSPGLGGNMPSQATM